MSTRYPILRSLDPHHQRIGYVAALCLVGSRGVVESADAINDRFRELLYEKIYTDDSRFPLLKANMSPEGWQELIQDRQRLNKKSQDSWTDEVFDFRNNPGEEPEWYTLNELWCHDRRMSSTRGSLNPEKSDRVVQLGQWMELYLPTYELSENGHLLQYLLKTAPLSEKEMLNPLLPELRPALWPFYIRLLLENEYILPHLLSKVVEFDAADRRLSTRTTAEGKDHTGVLKLVVDEILASRRNITDPEELNEFLPYFDFSKAIEKNPSTEENYLRPRMEIMVDLGLMSHKTNAPGKRVDFNWKPNERGIRAGQEWSKLIPDYTLLDEYLDGEFFSSMGSILAKTLRKPDSDNEILLWFARSYQEIGREFGFTPGRSLAFLSCLLAWEKGVAIEINDVYRVIMGEARGTFERFLHFSGGSRFDQEFLIRIDNELLSILEQSQKASNGAAPE